MTLVNRFPQIIATLPRRVDEALDQGARLIEFEAKQRVPVDQGDLRANIDTFDEGDLPVRSQYRVQAGNRRVFYGHMVEFGTTDTAPQPFLIPAFEQELPEIAGMVLGALRTL